MRGNDAPPPDFVVACDSQEGSDFWHAATSLALLTDALYEKWVLKPERLREAESMREAGLGAAGAGAGAVNGDAKVKRTPAEGWEEAGRY